MQQGTTFKWSHGCLIVALSGACQISPTEPMPAHGQFVEASIWCEPVGVDLKCDFWIFGGGGQLTDEAAWSVSNDAVASVSSNTVTTHRRGEVDITAAYRARSATWSTRLDPEAPPARLLSLRGDVKDGRTKAAIEGVVIEILEGYGKGSWAISDDNGYYRIDRVLLEEIFEVRAFKPGYETMVVAFPDGVPSAIHHFELSRSASP